MAKNRVDISSLGDGNVNDTFEYLYNTYVDELYAFGLHMGVNRSIVKDAIHDVFLALLTRNRALADIKDMKSYLLRSLNNRIIDLWRGHTEDADVDMSILNTISVEGTGIEKFDDIETAKSVASCLNSIMSRLSYQQRSAIYLRFMCEMKYKTIATILNCTEHAARKFVSKGLANMRKYQTELGQWKNK